MMKHHSHVAEILANKANEKDGETIAEATKVVEGEGATTRGANDEARTEAGHVKEIVNMISNLNDEARTC